MIFLFNQHWDIIPGKEEEYTKFAINHYIPTMKKIGINPVGGFYVVVGEGPGVISVGTVDSLQKLQKAMETEEYEKVTAQVQCYVLNYCSRILKPTGRVKTDKYTIQLRVWKFNQYFNIIPGKEKEYSEFITKDHLPTMEKLGYKDDRGMAGRDRTWSLYRCRRNREQVLSILPRPLKVMNTNESQRY